MKILHLLNTNRYSGAENVVCQIIGMFSSDGGYEMLYCSPKGDIEGSLRERGVRYVGIEALTCKEVKRVIAEQKPDLIHAHDMRASFIAACVCGRIPLVSHIHNNAYDARAITLKSVAYLAAARKAKHIFWVSQSAFDGYAFHKTFARKSSVLYNVIDVGSLLAKAESDPARYPYDVVYLGRLTYPKNPHKLLDVCSCLVSMKNDINIAIVGTGELEREIVNTALEKGLSDNVSFLGFQNNPYQILRDAKCMIMTSRWEGTPMCALEAMALGVPVVTTPVDGLKQLIADGENGFLSDDNAALAQRIFDIVTDGALHKKLSENQIKKSAEMNCSDSYRERLREVYRQA